MQYKGDDLDLRVPQARAPRESYQPDYDALPGNGRWARPRTTMASVGDTLWVDEVLLACCNYAYDVAQANGAAEVDLEHLVNALTRVDAAARILEARGVHEGQLRRESAALIASEVPAANAGDALAPRRSPELEDALRRASDLAYRRGTPAGVDDVLWVLLHYGRDLPVVSLLRRHTPDWQRADWGRSREMHIPEAHSRSYPMVASDGMSARVAGIEDSLRVLQVELMNERKLLTDLVRDIQRDVVAQRGDGAAFRGDIGQRLDTLERAVQLRGDNGRFPSQIADRLAAIEKGVQGSFSEVTRATTQISQRLSAVEMRLADAGFEEGGKALGERMTGLEKAVHSGLGEGARNWANMGQRLSALEKAIEEGVGKPSEEQRSALEAVMSATLNARLGVLEEKLGEMRVQELPNFLGERVERIDEAVARSSSEAARQWSALSERMNGITRLVESMAGDNNRMRLALAEQFHAIEAGLTAQGGESGLPPSELIERIGGLERSVRAGFGEAATNITQMMERIGTVERTLGERRGDDSSSEALLILDDRLGSIERMMETRGDEVSSFRHEMLERIGLLEQRPLDISGLDVGALIGNVTEKMEGLGAASVSKVAEMQGDLSNVMAKLSQLEEQIKAEAVANEEALRGRDQDFDFIYNEIKQLGQSQATLNSAVSDWRSESQTHFGTIADRLDKWKPGTTQGEHHVSSSAIDFPSVVTKARNGSDRPEPAHEPGAANGEAGGADKPAGQAARDVAASDYQLPPEPGRGFWYWLFGTNNISQANRENTIQVARMRQNIREAKERRRQVIGAE